MKIINDLLHIKTHREHQAELALAQAGRALRNATEAVKRAEDRLSRAHVEHDAKKRALYDDLFSRLVQLADLDLARSKLEKIDAELKQRELELHDTREKLALAEQTREQRRMQFAQASRDREKYTELSLQAEISRRQIQSKKDDMELEELIPRRLELASSGSASYIEGSV